MTSDAPEGKKTCHKLRNKPRRHAHNKPLLLSRLGLAIVSLFLVGCGQRGISSEYGATRSPAKHASLNGLGVFEKLCLQSGMKLVSATRLSPRLDKADGLILVGDTFHPPAKEARDWMEAWLAKQSGRTILYFGRDFDATAHYMQHTLAGQPPQQLPRARIDLAWARVSLDARLTSEVDRDVFCRWFVLRVEEPERLIRKFAGPWGGSMDDQAVWPVRSYLDVADPELAAVRPTWPAAPALTPTFRFPRRNARSNRRSTPRTPTGAPQPTAPQPVVYTSVWSYLDIGDDETWDAEWEKAPEAEVLLAGADGTPLVTRLTSERYPNSRIITVANGAPLFNGMMIQPQFRTVAQKIIAEMQPGKRLAVLPFSQFGIQVSEIPDNRDDESGLAVLLTWPMNMVIAHLTFLGLLFCLALYPIIGRPQSPRAGGVSDFGQHAEALGQMLSRTRDLSFARTTVANYLRIVRGETLPGWLQSPGSNPPSTDDPPTTLP
ncbi:MAG: hypothetical protein IT423_08980 [Pirellulaceae bacterium]|nr:hypothetical protein [Pirellulaceae bacterium]